MGRRGTCFQQAAQFIAIHSRHHHIADDEIALACFSESEGIGPIQRGQNLEILGSQSRFQQFHIRKMIVNNQNPGGHAILIQVSPI
jgi:hypothetical protein